MTLASRALMLCHPGQGEETPRLQVRREDRGDDDLKRRLTASVGLLDSWSLSGPVLQDGQV